MTIEDDRQAIADLVRLERFHRDRRRWDERATDYVGNSRVKTTWFEGTGREFAAASRDIAARGRESIHLIWPAEIRVNGDRALCESNAHAIVAIGEEPALVVAVGARKERGSARYPFDATAARHGASAERDTDSAAEAYARFSAPVRGPAPDVF